MEKQLSDKCLHCHFLNESILNPNIHIQSVFKWGVILNTHVPQPETFDSLGDIFSLPLRVGWGWATAI